MKPFRWAILGLGRIAHKFAQDLSAVPNATLFAVASTSQDRADDFARQYGVPHALGSYGALAQLEGVDAVYVATPHVQHKNATLLCLNAGLPVLCEKPFGMDAAEVAEMVQTAQERQVFLMEALWSRFMPSIQKTHELIKSGAIGKVRMIQADFGFKANYDPAGRLFNRALGGGATLDIGIYPLFLSYLMLGRPDRVEATAQFGATGVDEQTGITLTWADGAMASLHCSLLAKTDTSAVIFGEEGCIRLPGRFHEGKTVILERSDAAPETFQFDRATFGYNYEAQCLMDCLAEGHTECTLWSLADSRELINLLDRVRGAAGISY